MEFSPTALPQRADTVDVENELYKFTFGGEWEKVVELYKTQPWLQMRGTTSSNDTALHMAISDDREDVVEILNPAFIFLHYYACGDTDRHKPYELVRRKLDRCRYYFTMPLGAREHFDLAFHIVKLYPDLVGRFNKKGITPLHVLASKPSAFRSGHYHHLTWCQKIIYTCK
ncbi:hypothetical protein K1719_009625 [Acacia pycnantha]|nr:hypothetical protein K1719_009625 [Acacia pycnantha]